jgi:hypothetical protein
MLQNGVIRIPYQLSKLLLMQIKLQNFVIYKFSN